jgi:hypothetical protein
VPTLHSIAPFEDGNETWLVLIGAGLFAAFPMLYAIFLPAFYLPITLMLFGLIFRGAAEIFGIPAESAYSAARFSSRVQGGAVAVCGSSLPRTRSFGKKHDAGFSFKPAICDEQACHDQGARGK